MDYTATIEIKVSGAEAAEESFLNGVCDRVAEVLGFEGEQVDISLSIDAEDNECV
jgi:hypothetical protein